MRYMYLYLATSAYHLDVQRHKALCTMPFGKRLKYLNNLGGWASFNRKKHKLEHLEEQENLNVTRSLI